MLDLLKLLLHKIQMGANITKDDIPYTRTCLTSLSDYIGLIYRII